MDLKSEQTQKERLLNFLQYLKIGQNAFENSVSIPTGSIFHWKNGNIPPKACEKIFSTYPLLNKIWLLTGDGDMLVDNNASTKEESRNNQGTTNEVVVLLNKQIEQLEYIVELQKDRILQLEKECEDLKKANSTATTSHATTA